MRADDVLAPVVVWPRSQSASPQQLLTGLSAALARALGGQEWIDLRRQPGCAASDGVAFPHIRTAALQRPAAAFARLAAPLDFEAADGRPCDLVYLLASPGTECEHLKSLARAARFFRRDAVREALRAGRSEDDLRAVFDGRRRADAA